MKPTELVTVLRNAFAELAVDFGWVVGAWANGGIRQFGFLFDPNHSLFDLGVIHFD